MEMYKQTTSLQVYSPPSHRPLCRDRVARPSQLSPWNDIEGQLRWIYICKSTIACQLRDNMVPQKKGTLIHPCSYATNMPHLVIVAWRPGLWHGLKEGCQMPRNQNMQKKIHGALPFNLAWPRRPELRLSIQSNSSSKVFQPNDLHMFFLGTSRRCLRRINQCIPRFQKQQNTKDATIQTQGPNTSWRGHLQHPIHPPLSIPCQQKQRG